jgi:hypothetical protein
MFSQKFSDRYRGETDDGFEDKNLFEKCIIKPAAVSGNNPTNAGTKPSLIADADRKRLVKLKNPNPNPNPNPIRQMRR